MRDYGHDSLANLAAPHPDVNTGISGSMQLVDWDTDDAYWREQYPQRPYARADRDYEHYRPAYEYGATAPGRHAGREWRDAEPELERGWETYRAGRSGAWTEVKDAVRDAWDRVTGRGRRDAAR